MVYDRARKKTEVPMRDFECFCGIAKEVSEETGFNYKDVKIILRSFLDIIVKKLLLGIPIKIVRFGRFTIKKYIGRTNNYATIETHYIPRFVYSKNIKRLFREEFSIDG